MAEPLSPVNGATMLAFLGASTNSGSGAVTTGTATITYTDQSTQTFTLYLTDWWSTSPKNGNLVAATCSYLNTWTGVLNRQVIVYYTDVTLEAGKTIQSVTCPQRSHQGKCTSLRLEQSNQRLVLPAALTRGRKARKIRSNRRCSEFRSISYLPSTHSGMRANSGPAITMRPITIFP